MRNCLHCQHWRITEKVHGTYQLIAMAKHDFGNCELLEKWQYRGKSHFCVKFKKADQKMVDKRKEGLGL